MPKYYRFRATSPTPRSRRSKDRQREMERAKMEADTSQGLILAICHPAPTWYVRRTSWRETPPLMGIPRQLATELRAPLELSDRPLFVFKIPPISSQELRFF